jgi:hypothetical protein
MFELGLSLKPSDYDIQVSSSVIEQRCMIFSNSDPHAPFTIHDPDYGFLLTELVRQAIPSIDLWAKKWRLTLERTVGVKAFGPAGPENKTAKDGELSSHFRTQDWILRRPQARID